MLIEIRGKLIPLTSRVAMTSGMKLRGTMLVMILEVVPSRPQMLTDSRSKLKI